MKRFVLFVLFTSFICTIIPAQTPVEKNGFITVKGTHIYNASGKPIQLKGLSSHGLQWYDNCYTQASLQALRDDWKADIFRITVYVNEDGYNTDTAKFIKRIDQIIGWCNQLGLYYLIDWHVLSPGNPIDATYSKAKSFFTYFAKKYGNTPNLLFEICNEPNPDVEKGGPSWNNIKQYAEPVIAQIRTYTNNIVIVGTPQWSQMPGDVVGNEIKAANVMYTFHFYAASHRNLKANLMTVSSKIPVFVTEWGIGSSNEMKNVIDTLEANEWLHYFKLNKITWSYWSYCDKGNTASLLDSGACADKAWSKVNATGAYVKKYLVNDAKMEQTKTFDVYKAETDKDGTMVMLGFSYKLKPVAADNTNKFTVTIDGKPATVQSLSLSGDSSTLCVHIKETMVKNDVIKLSYSKGTIATVENYALVAYKNTLILNTVPPPGVFGFVVPFTNNAILSNWINTDDQKYQYNVSNNEMTVSANYTKQGWYPFNYHIPAIISLLHTPTVTITVKSTVACTLRLDIGDEANKLTNMNDISVKLPAGDTYQTYTFDYTGKFFQQYPSYSDVDASKINTLSFFVNPGKTFAGTLSIKSIIVGRQP